MIAIDPHKASWTAAAVDASLQPWPRSGSRSAATATGRCAGSPTDGPTATWAIEGAAGLGAPLTTRLTADGIDVVDVPAKLAARVRMLSTGHGRKNDDADAVSVAVAALTARTLNTAAVDEAVTALRALVEHRDDLVKTRTQTVNRLHVLLTQLIPAGAPRELTADARRRAAAPGSGPASRRQHPAPPGRRPHRRDPPPRPAHRQGRRRHHRPPSATSGTTLTELRGIGALTAGKILARVGTSTGSAPRRRSPPTPAPPRSRCPPVTSSATGSPAPGTANSTAACTSWPSPRSATTPRPGLLPRKRADGKSHKEALRCLKRRLSDVVYRQLLPRRRPAGGGPGRTLGGDSNSSAAGSNPYHRLFGQVTSRTRHQPPYNRPTPT